MLWYKLLVNNKLVNKMQQYNFQGSQVQPLQIKPRTHYYILILIIFIIVGGTTILLMIKYFGKDNVINQELADIFKSSSRESKKIFPISADNKSSDSSRSPIEEATTIPSSENKISSSDSNAPSSTSADSSSSQESETFNPELDSSVSEESEQPPALPELS